MTGGGKIISIQFLRAIASLLVLQVHLFTTIPFTNKIFCGSIGVDIFFVISGYIIAESVTKLPSTKPALTFFINRFSRVAPYYYLLTIIAAIFVFIFSRQFNVVRLVKSFLFIPDKRFDPTLFLGWSLIHEMFFYLFVTIMIALFANIKMVWIAISFFCLISICSLFSSFNYVLAFFGASMNYTFILGALILSFKDKLLPFFSNKAWLISSCVLLFLIALFTTDASINSNSTSAYKRDTIFFYSSTLYLPRIIVWGIPSAFLFICFLARELHFVKWRTSLMVKIGDASYSLYLLQAFTVLALLKIMFLNTGIMKILLAFGTIYAALEMFKIESAMSSYCRRQLKQKFL